MWEEPGDATSELLVGDDDGAADTESPATLLLLRECVRNCDVPAMDDESVDSALANTDATLAGVDRLAF